MLIINFLFQLFALKVWRVRTRRAPAIRMSQSRSAKSRNEQKQSRENWIQPGMKRSVCEHSGFIYFLRVILLFLYHRQIYNLI